MGEAAVATPVTPVPPAVTDVGVEEFVVVWDLGRSGRWAVVLAPDREAVHHRCPGAYVLPGFPAWMSEAQRRELRGAARRRG